MRTWYLVGILLAGVTVLSAQTKIIPASAVNGSGASTTTITLPSTEAYRIAMATPTITTATKDDGSGSLLAGIYKVTVVAVDPAGGVTLYPTALSATCAGGTSHIDVVYVAPAGWASIRVYVTAANGATPDRDFTSTSATAYAFTTVAGATVAALPATASAYRVSIGYNASNINWLGQPLVTPAESYVGPSSTTGVYFKGGNVGIGLTPAATNKLDILDTTLAGSGSLAGSALNIAQTWNTSGAPTGLKFTITDTASGSGALAMQILGGAAGTTNLFKVTKGGAATVTRLFSSGGSFGVAGASQLYGATDGIWRATNNAESGLTRFIFGPDNSSFIGIAPRAANGLELLSGVGTSTFNDAGTAASGTVAVRSIWGIFTQPTYSATNASVTYSDAATWYVANAPTAGTNVTITRPWSIWSAAGYVRSDGGFAVGATGTGVTGTSAGCVITAITGGIITGATCAAPEPEPLTLARLQAQIAELQQQIAQLLAQTGAK